MSAPTFSKVDTGVWETTDGKWAIEHCESQFDDGEWYLIKDLVSNPGFGVIHEECETLDDAMDRVISNYVTEETT